ncbi:MAG: BREX system ATP-binding domain-containing protein [Anaerolineales bacterium]
MRLLRQIESGECLAPSATVSQAQPARVHLPAYLQENATPCAAPVVFVGRDAELQTLESALQEIIAGTGTIRFVTGGAGSGKTALMEEFARHAASAHPDLLVALGGCSALRGAGDSYLPFRDILDMLTGDLEVQLTAGKISLEAAQRVWMALPLTLHALLEQSSDLIEVFISGSDLLKRANAALGEQSSLFEHLAGLTARQSPAADLEPAAIFEEYLQVLCAISKEYPVLLLLDDLQWADPASLNLLFHLGRRIASGRILLVVAYREEEASLAALTQTDPLKKALAEFKRQYGDIWIDLSAVPESQRRAFVDAFLDSEPNHLDAQFRQALYAHTGGHALFTVELCRNLQERSMLQRDEQGYWQEQFGLVWDELPARVEGVIEARLGRLDGDQRAALEAGAIEGEEFTLQVAAQVWGKDERWMVRQLSQELCQTHRLLSEIGIKSIDGRSLYRYRFRHSLYREYLYQHLGEIDRSWIHGRVAAALEELYGNTASQIAAQLGWHYRQAGETSKAIHYLLLAGDQAQQRYAYAEAIGHYQTAVDLLKESGDTEQVSRTLLKLGMAYHANLEFERSQQAYAEGFSLWHHIDASKSSASLVPAQHPLRIYWKVPEHLNKIIDDTQLFSIICNQVFCGLVSYIPEMGIIPDGAGSWEILDDGLRYIFHLRPDAAWSDGVSVTAQDYIIAWVRALNPALKPINANLLFDLKGARDYYHGMGSAEEIGVNELDPFTLQVELEQPAGYFLHLLAYNYTFPVPSHVLEAHGESWAIPGRVVTNGSFKIDEWQGGQRMMLSRNPNYHGIYQGNVNCIDLRNISDILECLKLYDADEIDILGPGDFMRALTLGYDLNLRYPGEYILLPDHGLCTIVLNRTVKPFDDLRVRQAFMHAIDKSIIANIPLSIFIPATGGLVPPSLPGHLPGIGLKFDPQRARQLLDEAGYPGGAGLPEMSVVVMDSPGFRLAVDILVNQWREVLGIEVGRILKPRRPGLHVKQSLEEGQRIALFQVGPDYPDCDWFLRCFVDDFVRSSTEWHIETYDQLLQAARLELDQQRRLKLYQEADKLIIEQAIVAPYYYSVTPTVIKPWVKLPSCDFAYQLWKDFMIEPH